MEMSVWAIVSNMEGEYLLLRRSKHISGPGEINFPGGKREKKEQPIKGVFRELLEEAGIKKQHLTVVKTMKLKYRQDLIFVGVLRAKQKNMRVRMNIESSRYYWLTPEELKKIPPNKLHYITRFIRKELKDMFITENSDDL